MKVLGQLENATLEILGADPSAATAGRMYYNTATSRFMLDDGTAKRAMLRNDGRCVFGTSATAAENVRFHRAGAAMFQVVGGADATAEGSLSTTLAQVGLRQENFLNEINKPTFGNPGRLAWLADTNQLQVDTGTSWIALAALTNGSVTTPILASGAVTQAKRAALGQQLSTQITYQTSGFSFEATGLSITITTTGRPVMLMLNSANGTQTAYFFNTGGINSNGRLSAQVKILRDATSISLQQLEFAVQSPIGSNFPVSAIQHLDVPAAGTYTYSVQILNSQGGANVGIANAKLVAYEL